VQLIGQVVILQMDLNATEAQQIHKDIESLFAGNGVSTPEQAKAAYPVLYDFYTMINPPILSRDTTVTNSLSDLGIM
jgi:hypothetical protein